MAEEGEKYDGNNIIFPEDTVAIKGELEDDGFIDNKIFISETVISASEGQLGDTVRNDLIKLELPTLDIKTELLPEVHSRTINGSVKPEGEIHIADDVKIEIDKDNRFLLCEQCHTYYEDYCSSCGMLVHILNRNVLSNADKVQEEIPEDILEVRDVTGRLGIFALKNIPQGVKFGPFTGLDISEFPWRIKGGEFVVSKDRSELLNWMQYIKPARSAFEQNLLACQYNDNLYYQSNSEIEKGEELLVYFGEEYEDSLKEDVEMDYIPTVKDDFKDVFACTLCCLGFSLRKYLGQHKITCRKKTSEEFSLEELTRCPFCKVNMWKKEYAKYHMAYCCQRNARKRNRLPSDNQTSQEVNKRKQRRLRQMHEGPYKCSLCEYTTENKDNLSRHTKAKHCEDNYECSTCAYKTVWKHRLEYHIKTIHLKQFDFKCTSCEYQTNMKQSLDRHIKAKHLGEFNYECDVCEFRTNVKEWLRRHVKSKHLREFRYKCALCELGTNNKSHFESHMKTKHLKVFNYKCEKCKYETNYKTHLKIHMKAKHLKEFSYNCAECEFKTNYEAHLRAHTQTIHLKEFNYKCDRCDYKTNYKTYMKRHVESQHKERV